MVENTFGSLLSKTCWQKNMGCGGIAKGGPKSVCVACPTYMPCLHINVWYAL